MLFFGKKIKKNTQRYYFTPVYQKYWWYDLQFLRNRVWQTEIGNYGSFFVLYPPPPPLKTQKIKTLKKWKKFLEISSFYTCVPKITIIWGVVPETRSKPDILFCNLGPFFALLPPITNLRIKILKKWKKHLEMTSFYTCVPKITIILCLLPETWSTTESFLSFWTVLCPLFFPTIDPKIKI